MGGERAVIRHVEVEDWTDFIGVRLGVPSSALANNALERGATFSQRLQREVLRGERAVSIFPVVVNPSMPPDTARLGPVSIVNIGRDDG